MGKRVMIIAAALFMFGLLGCKEPVYEPTINDVAQTLQKVKTLHTDLVRRYELGTQTDTDDQYTDYVRENELDGFTCKYTKVDFLGGTDDYINGVLVINGTTTMYHSNALSQEATQFNFSFSFDQPDQYGIETLSGFLKDDGTKQIIINGTEYAGFSTSDDEVLLSIIKITG